MQEAHSVVASAKNPYPPSFFPGNRHSFRSFPRPKNCRFVVLSYKTITSAPQAKPPKELQSVSPPPPENHSEFEEKMLYLDSIGLDFLSLINRHPPIATASLLDLKSTIDYLVSMNFTPPELRRMLSMCPPILTAPPSSIIPIFTFLLREALVNGSDLKRVIYRRPRLLVCCVESRLRPTLYFLQSIGIAEVNKHTSLLSCSVEDKFIPRIEYFKKIGFSHRETVSMFRRFPELFNYSIMDNYEPKLNYFVVEMGRDLKELKEFPQYFSFSLENRIKPRHQCCVEKGVFFPLHVLLKTSEAQFRDRLDLCCNSSMPSRNSPLWCPNCSIDDSM